jgi:hypothetical protein
MLNADQATTNNHTSYFCDWREMVENKHSQPRIFESSKYTDQMVARYENAAKRRYPFHRYGGAYTQVIANPNRPEQFFVVQLLDEDEEVEEGSDQEM